MPDHTSAWSGPPSRLPDDPVHRDDARYRQVLAGVERLGQWPQQEARNLAAALYADVARNPVMHRVDDVVLGSPLVSPREIYALYRPGGDGPLIIRASVAVTMAAETPAASQSLVDESGYLIDPGIIRHPVAALEHGALQGPRAIVMHRTGGASATGALAAFASGTGTHFLIDKDGTIYQTASLGQKTHHVGKIRSRCFTEATCAPADQKALDALGFAPRAIHDREKSKAYPQRYPTNEDSVGIEVVSRYTTHGWESPTPQQQAAVGRLVGILQQQYDLGDRDVYEHDVISYKTQGEGAGLYQPAGADADVVHSRGPAR